MKNMIFVALLLYFALMQQPLQSMAPVEVDVKSASGSIQPLSIYDNTPNKCMPMVLCRMIADYTKEWQLQPRTEFDFRCSVIHGLLPLMDKDRTWVLVDDVNYARIWDLQVKKSFAVQFPHNTCYGNMAYAKGKKILISKANDVIRFYNLADITDEELGEKEFRNRRITMIRKPCDYRISMPAISPDENAFAIGLDDGAVHIMSLPEGELLHAFQVSKAKAEWKPSVMGLAWNCDGTMLASRSEYCDKVRIWRYAEKISKVRTIHFLSRVVSLACSPVKNRIVVKTEESLSCREMATGKIYWSISIESDEKSLVFSPSGDLIASAFGEDEWRNDGRRTKIGLWDAETGTLVAFFPANAPTGVASFLADDRLITSGVVEEYDDNRIANVFVFE